MIAEYERAKTAEHYRRLPREGERAAHLEVFEPEAVVVRRIFEDYTVRDLSMRELIRGLAAEKISTPKKGNGVWGSSTIARLLRNEAYIGRVYFNHTASVPDPRPGHRPRQVPRPREDWIAMTGVRAHP
ncbi:recombinase family protein [Streptomyces sp. NPDC055085]